MRFSLKWFAIALFALAALTSLTRSSRVAFAADVTSTWSAATAGTWNVNANWTNAPALGGFPNNGNAGVATYDAVISATGSPYTVSLNTNVTIEDLSLSSANATLSHTSGTLTATGAINLAAGTYSLAGGTISNTTVNVTGGTLTFVSNTANLLTGVAVNGDLTFNSTNARTKIAGGTTFNTAHLGAQNASLGFAPGQSLTSTILFEGAGNERYLEMNGSAGTFTVGSTGVIRTVASFGGDAQIGGGIWYGGAAMTLTNQGLISSQASGRTVTISAASLANSATGILEATGGGILTINSTTWSNAGNLRALMGSTANLNGAWSNLGGTITADATSTLNLGGSFSTPNLGALSLAAGSKVNVTGAWDNSGQTFTLNAATGSWTLAGGSISGGSIGFADGKALVFTSNTALLTGVTINGDLTLNTIDARTKIAGGTTFNTAHLAGSATSLGFAPGYTLASTVLFEGAAFAPRAVEMNGTAGTFTVGPTGVIRTEASLGVNAQIGGTLQFGGAMTLVNQGLISSQTSGRTVTIHATSFTNSGTLEAINGGQLAVPSGFTQTIGVTRLSGTFSAMNGPTTNTITMNGGRLEGSGTMIANVANSATIAPGAPVGALTITGDLTLASTSSLQIDIGSAIQGSGHDFIREAGNLPLNLAGTLDVTLLNGFMPTAADSLIILSSNQPITGMFSNVVDGRVLSTDGLTSLGVSVIGNHVVVAELPGDYNGNGIVDAADYVVWRKGLGATHTPDHYAVWRASFGVSNGGSGATAGFSSSAVPEPASLALLFLAAACMLVIPRPWVAAKNRC